ncbi:hypothetical protein G6F57_004926 [Rhizopus arrhizus]|nr:hypothetical protein G6F24_004589 [Rhizopus arrhizus]KAG1428431.1 hypothetical protein G6F58_000555 [Rhizopus delemar]KAG0785400.1 hypothetical protein G6F21_009287 [Rhizopus arrhizus]KAG0791906.1 hypothetical protein G6F22_006009 [Rhizopus arrhizus]KAG0813184.1 hypothetical protein G6F20_005766 [Rhizopus arrhizus]
MTPPRLSSRLSNKGTISQSTINKFLVTTTSLADQHKKVQQQQPPTAPETKHATPDNKILEGVVACLDVRTEDGDDVSQNFERALQSMGAKTRRTFSDSCTHLIFKNGSPATIKKALSKNVHIINLLWISRCKKEGKRLSEKDFIIERPQSLVLAAKKRRKSMEPSKVRALGADHPVSSGDSSPTEDLYELRNQRLEEERRKTIGVPSWKRRQISTEGSVKRMVFEPFVDEEEEEYKHKTRLSLPLSVEASRHIALKRAKPAPVAPSPEMKEHIKARFSIGQKVEEGLENNKERMISLFPSISTTPSQVSTTPIRRKRRLTGNATPRQPIEPIPSPSLSASSIPSFNPQPVLVTKSTIVFTSLTSAERNKYEGIIKSLGTYKVVAEVDERTTHVIVGSPRRTKSVALGLVKGLWILSPEWLMASKENGKYVAEDEYELLKWYPRANIARQRLPFMPSTTCIKVNSVSAGKEFTEQLVRLAGGHVVKEMEEANVVISNEPLQIDKIVVSESWLYESIEQWTYLSTEKFTL